MEQGDKNELTMDERTVILLFVKIRFDILHTTKTTIRGA